MRVPLAMTGELIIVPYLILAPMIVAIIATFIDQRLAYRAYDVAASLADAPPKHWRWLNYQEFAFWDHILDLARRERSEELVALLRRHRKLFAVRIAGVVASILIFLVFCAITET